MTATKYAPQIIGAAALAAGAVYPPRSSVDEMNRLTMAHYYQSSLSIPAEFISVRDYVAQASNVPKVADKEARFKTLMQQWRDEVGGDSSLSRITGNINYLRIIALGDDAIPLILRELQREPAPWFMALRAISGRQDIGAQHAGDFTMMARDWIRWGQDNRHL